MPVVAPRRSFWSWFRSLFAPRRERPRGERTPGAQEARVLAEFCRQYGTPFRDLSLLKLALTHRSYLSVTGQGPRESNERLEFLGDSVLGLVTSEFLYRRAPDEHEGQLTKTKSLLVSKAILSRRALRIGLGRFVLMSHSEVESGGRQRLSILADAFESVIGAIYLDQGFESARTFIHKHLLEDSDAISADKRHTNYKSHLQEYVQNAFRTHPVYRIRSEFGPDHSKHFVVEVMVGKRTLGEGRGHNKKEAEQAAARDALEKVEKVRRKVREDDDRAEEAARDRRGHERGGRRGSAPARAEAEPENEAGTSIEELEPLRAGAADDEEPMSRRRRSRRGGRRRHARGEDGRPEPRSAPDADASSREHAYEPEPVIAGLPAEPPEVEPPREPRAEPPAPVASSYDAARALPASPVPPGPAESAPGASRPAYGRGRRRESGPAALPGPAPPPAESAATPRVDPFEAEDPAATPGERAVPVMDVAAAEAGREPEGERERDARIDEMERALENFGRRRSPDYGRRGRRR